MREYDLAGRDVGRRALDALRRDAAHGPIVLRCRGARFRDHVEFEGITFLDFDASMAIFERGMTLIRCEMQRDAYFEEMRVSRRLRLDHVVFAAGAYLRRMDVAALQLDRVEFKDYATLDQTKVNQVVIRNVNFAAEARMRRVIVRNEAKFHGVDFGGVASFHDSEWGSLRLAACSFAKSARFDAAYVAGGLSLAGCRMADSRNLELHSGESCELSEMTFEQPLQLRVRAPKVDATSTSFERGVDLILSPRAHLDLTAATLGGPSLITTDHAGLGSEYAHLVSLQGTRLGQLTLRSLDLSGCAFARAHALDDVVISGRGQLASAPAAASWLGRREALPDEFDYRHARELRRRPYGPHRWYRSGAAGADADGDAATLAETYRALRRGRESARDKPGAADFYFGEMEMRRLAARSVVDRCVLTAYWLLSGYGLRASRALVAYALVVPAVALALHQWGLQQPASFGDVLAYVLATTTVLARPAADLSLDTFGSYLQVVARLVGPALFALMLVALRSRVRR